MTTRTEISIWFDQGIKKNATHMIVFCDSFSYEDFPCYLNSADEVKSRIELSRNNMQRVMEIYDLSMDKNSQLDEHRAYHI